MPLDTRSERHPTAARDGRAVRLTIPARPEYISLVRLALTGLSRLRPLPDDTLSDLKLAVTEACSNSVRHAYRDGHGPVEILYELHADRLVVGVADDGQGFIEQPANADGSRELREGGLGMAIIEAIADEFEFGGRRDGRGARLRFVKFLAA